VRFNIDTGSDKTEERYGCFVGPHGKMRECRGFQSTAACKRLAALVALIEAGYLTATKPTQNSESLEEPGGSLYALRIAALLPLLFDRTCLAPQQ
jgi:hypothetical protein